ncbi:DUF2326 domain-containing protein [Clostridium tertium]|uniref:DUF2326 domain-containing protein n=1 Tax=Clostridium tertium TaxID=1559 RepID=UPI0024B397DF|nr:DUF2326 domain-containing protein [Clostridium tertium]MDI9215599.1 DUF2326 domain-containing protein [Clostridium tertium]
MDSNIFINKLMIYPQLGKCNVEFRNGLNIVWSKDIISKNKHEEKNLRNSVGKTTFVKFIDYLLGRNFFIVSIDSTKRELFENRSLLAEVIFGTERFTIKRSVLENDKIYIFNGWVIDKIITDVIVNDEALDLKGYNEFLTKKIYGENIIVNDKVYVNHRNIMTYLIRDQSVGFIKFDSGLKEEKAKSRRKRLEFLLGLVSEKREQLEKDIDVLEKEKEKFVNERNILKKYFELVSDTTLSKLNKKKVANEKQIKVYEDTLDKKADLLSKLKKEIEESKSLELELNKKSVSIDEEIYLLSLKEKDYEMASKDIENELYKIKNINLAIDLFSPFGFKRCPVYMKELVGEKVACEYIAESKNKSEFKSMTEARKKILTFEKKDIKDTLSKVTIVIKDLKREKARVLNEINKNKELQIKIEADIEEKFYKLEEKVKELRHENEVIEKEIGHFQYVDKLKENIDDKKTKITEKKGALESIIESRAFEINQVYNKIIKYLTNNSRIGKINPKDYVPGIYHPNGNIDKGSAMGNVAVIAFDLAMLELSLKFQDISSVYPKFLVHDSPKLHDIQIEIYNRIMDYVVNMEIEYRKHGKEFQYILTTLDISDSIEKDKNKYIRLTLNNSGDGGKLFGCQVEID